MLKFLVPLVAIAFVAHPADAAKKRKHAARQAPVAASKSDGPRMIEIHPGYWISNWGCYTDDGYGRIGPCDGRDGTD